jgi:hypothetical protein
MKRTLVGSLLLATAPLLLLCDLAPAAEWGDLTGKFVYGGPAPKPGQLAVTKDENCCGKNVPDESLVVGADGGIANVVIYVRTKLAENAIHPEYVANAPKQVIYDNKSCRFEPHVLGVWLSKTAISLHNSDMCAHNSNLAPILDKAINPLLPPMAEQPYSFNREQNLLQPVNCNIHPWMKGYILPRSNPYFAVTGADGSFTIKNLPAGEHEFQVLHEQVGYLIAQPEWKTGKFKMAIKPGKNVLGKDPAGVVKVAPASLQKKS